MINRYATAERLRLISAAKQKDMEAAMHFAAGRKAAGTRATMEATALRQQALRLPEREAV